MTVTNYNTCWTGFGVHTSFSTAGTIKNRSEFFSHISIIFTSINTNLFTIEIIIHAKLIKMANFNIAGLKKPHDS